MNIFDEINDYSAEMLLSRINLPIAKDGKSYRCPVCDKGKGGDGIRPRRNSKGRVKWHCFGECGKDYSNFDLAAATLGLDAERDKAEAIIRLKELFGIIDDETFSFSKDKKSARNARGKSVVDVNNSTGKNLGSVVAMDEKKSASESEPKNFAKFYEYCRANVTKFLESNGGSYRGLTSETFEKYGLGINPEFGTNEDVQKVPALIIPYDEQHFVARKVVEVQGNQKVTRHGQGAGLYEPVAVKVGVGKINFVFEGEIDSLSVAQVFSKDLETFGIVATGGKSNWRKVVPELDKRFADVEDKPKFVVVFDNDSGMEDAAKLVADLRAANYPAESFFFEERKAGEHEYHKSDGTTEKVTVKKIDANDLLQKGSGKLIGRLFDGIEQNESRLKKQAKAIKAAADRERTEAATKSGIRDFPFSEYFAAQFFRDVELTARYSNRDTGFDNLDGKGEFKRDGRQQIFMPGLYLLGALPGAGKTSFAAQLVSQLAEQGEFCIFCSYEMSVLELYSKWVARELFKQKKAGHPVIALSSADIRCGVGKGIEEVNKLAKRFAMSAVNIRVLELSNTNVVNLIKYLSPLVENAEKPPIVILDYLQIAPAINSKATTKEKIDDLMLRLKDFQRATNTTLIIISAFNRASGQDAKFESFRESSAIEYSADVVWALQLYGVDNQENKREKLKSNPRPMAFRCLKNRNGGVYEVYFNYYPAGEFFKPCKKGDLDYDDD